MSHRHRRDSDDWAPPSRRRRSDEHASVSSYESADAQWRRENVRERTSSRGHRRRDEEAAQRPQRERERGNRTPRGRQQQQQQRRPQQVECEQDSREYWEADGDDYEEEYEEEYENSETRHSEEPVGRSQVPKPGQEGSLSALLKSRKREDSDAKLVAERAKLEKEVQILEDTLRAQKSRALRANFPGETFVWVLVEYDNHGAERYLSGYASVPDGWQVLMFRNRNATGHVPNVMGAQGILSHTPGKCKKNDRDSMSYPAADIGFTAGDIAVRAAQLGIAACTTVYFVFSPVMIPGRFDQESALLQRCGIQSYFYDAQGSLDEILTREGLQACVYKPKMQHEAQRSQSVGPRDSRTRHSR